MGEERKKWGWRGFFFGVWSTLLACGSLDTRVLWLEPSFGCIIATGISWEAFAFSYPGLAGELGIFEEE